MNIKDVKKLYDEGKSVASIAKMYDTYTNKVRRLMIKHGYDLRDRSETQKLLLEQGLAEHPTKGKVRSEATKTKISETNSKRWEEMSEEELQKVKESSKDRWNQRDPEDIKNMREKAYKAMNETGRKGSKIERYILKVLLEAGYDVEFHKQHWLQNEKMEVDMMIKSLNTAIEVDGPIHYMDVFGPDRLEGQQKADKQKNGLLLSKGMFVIRIKIPKNTSQKFERDIKTTVLEVLDNIKNNKYGKNERLINV